MARNPLRIIPRLDIKWPNLIKTIQLEGLRVIGSPKEFALQYYKDGADEIILNDCVASLYGRNSLLDLISDVAEDIFIPLTVGGGIRSVEDARLILRAGADKVFVNTSIIKNPALITDIAEVFGTQAMVAHIEAKKIDNHWEPYYDNGRERSGLNVVEWAVECEKRGAGEILLTSIDNEGTKRGFDFDLLSAVLEKVNIPVIASGGFGNSAHGVKADQMGASGIAIADHFHYKKNSVHGIKGILQQDKVLVRL